MEVLDLCEITLGVLNDEELFSFFSVWMSVFHAIVAGVVIVLYEFVLSS